MDNHVSSWILEFVLRQPIHDSILIQLLSTLPHLDSDLRLKKTLLLRSLLSFLANPAAISDSVLQSIEMLEEVDHRLGSPIPDSLQAAYSSVAVECAAKFLREEPEDYTSFAAAVDRTWHCRVGAMERWEGGTGLLSKRLRELKKEMLVAVVDSGIRSELHGRDTRKEALDSVSAYLEEALEQMGPPFLEFAAEAGFCGRRDWKNAGGNLDGGGAAERPVEACDAVGGEFMDVSCNQFEKMNDRVNVPSAATDMHDGGLCPSGKEAVPRGGIVSNKDSVFAMPKENGNDGMKKKYDPLPTPEVRKAQEALRSSSLELQAVVEDPLPNALKIAAGISSLKKDINQEGLEQNLNHLHVDPHNSSIENSKEANDVGASDAGNQDGGNHGGKSRPGFMARNETAHTFEWDDSSFSSEGSPSSSRKLHLPSPNRRVISPLKQQEIARFVRKRKIKKWSLVEEETLRNAVIKHGVGRWKFILLSNPTVFDGRTEIDLKDKWRNMLRHS